MERICGEETTARGSGDGPLDSAFMIWPLMLCKFSGLVRIACWLVDEDRGG